MKQEFKIISDLISEFAINSKFIDSMGKNGTYDANNLLKDFTNILLIK